MVGLFFTCYFCTFMYDDLLYVLTTTSEKHVCGRGQKKPEQKKLDGKQANTREHAREHENASESECK